MVSALTKRKRTAADAWIESLDPLNGLSIAQARSTYNAARRHGSPLLQKMYAEIEESDPVLMTCVDRRQSALAGLGWRTVANASARDAKLAEEQRVALEEFANGIGNLDDVIEHLGLAFFRGYSVCQPIWEEKRVRHVELLDSWNFLKGDHGELLWNPECSMDPARCEEITPEARAVVFQRRRAIDWPALNIYIRKYIGERDWGRFLERYGIPPVDVVMAPNTTNAQRDDYLESAEAARDGRPAAWPAGSQISRAEGSRGQDPFSAYLDHQERLIVLMATGGTLTSLAESGTGTLAGGAQMDVWTQIVSRDGVAISAILNRAVFAPFLREAFPGWNAAAHLELGHEDEPTAAEAADMAVKLRSAGYRVDQGQLEEATGYKLEREEPAPQQPGFGGGLAFNKAPPAAKPVQSEEDAKVTKLAAAFQQDMRPVGEELRKLLETSEGGLKAACNSLAKRLPTMIPTKPAMAQVLEEEAAGEVAAVANSECRAKDPAHCRVHGMPEKRPLRDQLTALGYKSRADLEAQARAVPSDRIARIATGDLKEHCKVHEAIAVLRANHKVKNAIGQDVTFGEDMVGHYLFGRGREDNQPDVQRLKELPLAMFAVKHDRNPKLQYPKGVTPDAVHPPRGTQYVYTETVGGGTMKCRAWVDSGQVKGWYVE